MLIPGDGPIAARRPLNSRTPLPRSGRWSSSRRRMRRPSSVRKPPAPGPLSSPTYPSAICHPARCPLLSRSTLSSVRCSVRGGRRARRGEAAFGYGHQLLGGHLPLFPRHSLPRDRGPVRKKKRSLMRRGIRNSEQGGCGRAGGRACLCASKSCSLPLAGPPPALQWSCWERRRSPRRLFPISLRTHGSQLVTP